MDDDIPLLKHGPAVVKDIINRIIKQLKRQRPLAGENIAISAVTEKGTLLRALVEGAVDEGDPNFLLPEPPSNGPLRWILVKFDVGEPPDCSTNFRWMLGSAAFTEDPGVEEVFLEPELPEEDE